MGDAFDVFDAPSATSPTNSPFRLFDAAAQSSAPAKRPRPATSILPVVRQFAEKHGGQTSADLLSIGQAELAKTLDTALSCLRDDPFEVSGCRAAANRVESLTWDALQVAGSWAHVSWREAYVMAQMLLCCADADGGAEEEALRRCDRAFILGGVSQVLRDIVQLLEPTGDDADDTESANAADGLAGPRAGSEIGGLGGPPSLQQHFSVPPLCGQGKLQHVNGWLGPGGTVTPLHFDSYDNLFAQVVGHKYIRLYDAEQSGRLYARKGGAGAGLGLGAQGNLSAVDVESPDLDAHPLFAAAEWSEVVLGPGEMLFVPSRCWHYVRSLSTSFSISFWF